MKKILITICCTALLLLEIFCIRGIATLSNYFPLENADAVVFTLTHNMSGAGDFALSIVLEILRDSLTISILTIFAIYSISRIPKTRNILTTPRLLAATNIICFGLLTTTFLINIPISKYYQKWNGANAPQESSNIYETEYINPDSVKIEFKEKRNLILIFLESVEYNFQDSLNGGGLSQNLIPEITEYIKQEQSFIPGGTKTTGTGWTIADVIAKTCGIPMKTAIQKIDLHAPHRSSPRHTQCLTDILHNNGYTTVISKGAQLRFAGMDVFSKAHAIDYSYGLDEYKRDWHIDERVLNEWGVSDSAHYELIKEHIGKVSTTGKPWAVWFITLNTHTPYGATDPACHISPNASNHVQLQSSIRCSSRQLDNFIKWAKAQKWYDKTTIAVMGDHASMSPSYMIGFKDFKQTHYWLDFFINSATSAKNYKRSFTSLDMFPTILESIGAKISGRALGLGRSLYSLAPTLLEQYGLDSLNKALESSDHNYDYYYFPKNKAPK